jgi:hypothetical protein
MAGAKPMKSCTVYRSQVDPCGVKTYLVQCGGGVQSMQVDRRLPIGQ